MSFQSFMKGIQLAEQEHESGRKRQQEDEDRKLQKQLLKMQMDKLKFEEAVAKRGVQAQTPGQHQVSPDLAPNIKDILTSIRSKPVAAQPMPIGGMAGETIQPPPSAPDRITHAPFPNIPSPYGDIPGTNLELEQERTMADQLTAMKQKAQEAGMVEAAKESAKAPSFNTVAPGALGVIGAGTEQQRTIQGPPRLETPTLQETDITVDGKGPVRAILVKKDDGSFTYLDATTRQPVQGKIGTYERPREATPLSTYGESNILNRLVQQWDKATADVRDLYRANTIMRAGMDAARRGNMNAGAQAVLVTFQKFLDPQSVVRESEYARSPEGLSMVNRIQGWYERNFQTGGAGVPLAELENFAKLAEEINNNLAKEGNSLLSKQQARIGRNAQRYGIPEDLIFSGYDFTIQPGGAATGSNRVVDFNSLPK